MKCALLVFILFNFACLPVKPANILGITTLLSHSHHFWNEVLAVALAERGHNVTLLSHDKKKKDHPNYHVILIEGIYEAIEAAYSMEAVANNPESFTTDDFWTYLGNVNEMDLQSEGLKVLMNYPQDYKFDLIIWDMNAGEVLYPLIKHFGNPPIVGTSPFGLQPYINSRMGGLIPNYIPFFAYKATDRMTFWQRLENTWMIVEFMYKRRAFMRRNRELAVKVFGEDIEELEDVERRFSVALVNQDPILDFPQAVAQNVVPVGGLQIEPLKPLPKDIQKILDDSKDGVIYFALGSNIKSESLNSDVLKSLTDCFKTLPQTVLWKIELQNYTMPKNVITKKWLPQSDILGHPNVKLFISHGGGLSTQEAMYRGVPVVGLPFFVDQTGNVEKLVLRKLGKKLEFQKISSKYVCEVLNSVLKDETYSENMKAVSRRVQDQPNKPLERAVFWVEYVLRHGGAEHLSPAPRDMSLAELQNWDILALLLLACTAPIVVGLFCCTWLCGKGEKSKIKQN